jgi:hypothetical protein
VAAPTRVYLEVGKNWVFACAVDWPGWARRGKGNDAALANLLAYRDRYAKVAGRRFDVTDLDVVGEVPGGATTDFGAPGSIGDWDYETLKPADAGRLAGLVDDCWAYFDRVIATAPPELRKGPRGGGRDRDAIAAHVRDAERAYAPKLGIRVPASTPWEQQRQAILEGLKAGEPHSKWPIRYAARRVAWHILDHAWEIEDRSAYV